MMSAGQTTYLYTFAIPGRAEISFPVLLNERSEYINSDLAATPLWAGLEHHRCPPCTLDCQTHPFCPVARNISALVTAFKDIVSHTACTVTCNSTERIVSKQTAVQNGLASILGLLMATSGCPTMDFFRPLARFHLPFASVDEATFRIAAVYMLKRFFSEQNGNGKLFSATDIKEHFRRVKQVNSGILRRIRDVSDFDADKNALITLNSLAEILEMEIDTRLESLHYLFK